MKICPVCGTNYPDDANFCPMDASKLTPVAAQAPAAAPSADGGAIAGRFAPGERLGGGMTGEVLLARDGQSGAQVALKLCNAAVFPSPITMERTQRELRQLQRLTCDGIAAIVDQGRLPDGRLYVAMERCDGVPLSAVVAAAGPMPFARARAIVMAIGDALTEAQKSGVVHRDVAPKNVLLGAGDRVKLINFGIAPRVNDRVFGVPEYLAPEQVEGRPVDQRANIYSLGAVLYQLVIGVPPHQGAPDAVLAAHLQAPIPVPSALRPELGPDVDRVLLKALERNPSRRHLTLRQFLTELEALPAQPVMSAGLDVTQRDMTPPPVLAPAGFVVPPTIGVGAPPPQVFPQAPMIQAQAAVAGQYLNAAPAPAYVPPPVQAVAPPVAVAPAPAPPAPAPADGGGGKAGFRETLWFKKGEVEEYLKQGASPGQPAEAPAEDSRPIEDRYVDDGSVTAADRAKFSLRTGGTQMMSAVKPPSAGLVPGERMSEKELADEYAGKKGSGLKVALIVIGIVVALGLVAGLTIFLGHKDEPKKAATPAAEVRAPADPAAAPAPAAPAPAP
jgi:serine/threonine-protein kinase